MPKLNAKSNNIDLRVRKVCFLKNIFGKRSNLPFSCKSDRKKEKSLVSFTHEQNIICSQKKMDNVVHFKQTIICRQLFAGHVVKKHLMVGSRVRLEQVFLSLVMEKLKKKVCSS